MTSSRHGTQSATAKLLLPLPAGELFIPNCEKQARLADPVSRFRPSCVRWTESCFECKGNAPGLARSVLWFAVSGIRIRPLLSSTVARRHLAGNFRNHPSIKIAPGAPERCFGDDEHGDHFQK